MIMYNVTVNVDHDAHDAWLEWMRDEHVPEVLATGYFTDARIARILAEEEGGQAYSIQYFAESMEQYRAYEEREAPRLRRAAEARFGGRFVAFRTLLHIVHDTRG
jgi:hypothetical protein